jgi:hypothetical protein
MSNEKDQEEKRGRDKKRQPGDPPLTAEDVRLRKDKKQNKKGSSEAGCTHTPFLRSHLSPIFSFLSAGYHAVCPLAHTETHAHTLSALTLGI